MSVAQPVWLQEVVNSYVNDPFTQTLLVELAITGHNSNGFSLVEGLLRKDGKIWVGANVGLQCELITAFHASSLGGHSGIQATYQRLKKLFSWSGMKLAWEEFVKQCSICQHAKHENCKYPGLPQPLPLAKGVWQNLTMDFIEGLPKSLGYSVISVVVDRYTKYAHFLPLKHPFTASHVAHVFMDNVVKLHGPPSSIVSDRDKVFTSNFWQALFKGMDVQPNMSTTYHPQSDGQTERVNQCLEMYLRCSVSVSPTKWASWLPLAEFWYNTSFHTTIGCSPFKALYGVEPTHGLFHVASSVDNTEADEVLQDRAFLSQFVQHHLQKAQSRMKQAADAGRSLREFQVGEQVLLKLQPYAQHSVVNRPYPKLAFKYFGPYTVLAKYGSAAYKLDLPAGSLVHPVFHVSQLKQFLPDHTPVFTDLPTPLQLDVSELQPEEILDRRLIKKGNTAYLQVLIKWTSLPSAMATWEDYSVLRERYPHSAAWGQAASQGVASVTRGVPRVATTSEAAKGSTSSSSQRG